MLPDDLRTAYETFTLLATHYGYAYAGMMLKANPGEMIAIGNCQERGHDMATLLRKFADLIDEKTKAGQVEIPPPANVN